MDSMGNSHRLSCYRCYTYENIHEIEDQAHGGYVGWSPYCICDACEATAIGRCEARSCDMRLIFPDEEADVKECSLCPARLHGHCYKVVPACREHCTDLAALPAWYRDEPMQTMKCNAHLAPRRNCGRVLTRAQVDRRRCSDHDGPEWTCIVPKCRVKHRKYHGEKT